MFRNLLNSRTFLVMGVFIGLLVFGMAVILPDGELDVDYIGYGFEVAPDGELDVDYIGYGFEVAPDGELDVDYIG